MSLEIDIKMCRICMKTNDGIQIYTGSGIIKKLQFCTQLKISKTDELPKIICNKCVGRLEIAYHFCKQAQCSDKYLRRVMTHHKAELNLSELEKQGLYDEMVLKVYRTRTKLKQDDQIEQLIDFESEEVSIVNISPTLEEGINCKGNEPLIGSVPVYAAVGECSAADKVKREEADIEKIQETKQINLFTIAKVTSIPKTEFNQTNEMIGNVSYSQEDIESLSEDKQNKVDQSDQMKQLTNVKSVKISETIEEGIQYKGSICGADIVRIENLQETMFTIEKVTSIRKNEDDQTDGITEKGIVPLQGTKRLTDSVPMYAIAGEYCVADKVKIEEIEEADIEKIQKTKQINLFTIAKVTSIPKTEFNQTNEMTGNVSCSQEDMKSLSDVTHINVERGDQLKQSTDVKWVTIPDTIEEDIQNKESTCGADIAKIEKSQETTYIKARVPSIRKNEDGKTDKFECIECGAHFTQNGSLKRHSLIHSGERPYKCNLCNRSFTQKTTLSCHMLRHSGDKSYICETCGLTFRHPKSLDRHIFMKHDDKNKAEVRRILLKQKEQYKRWRQLMLARETPEETALRREKLTARRRRRRRLMLARETPEETALRREKLAARERMVYYRAKQKQPTDVKSVTISDTIEEDIQYKESTCGADIAIIEKSQETTFIKAKVRSIRKNEDDQTDGITGKGLVPLQGTKRLTDSVPIYAVAGECCVADKVKIEEIEEADIEKIQKTKQINLFTIAKVTSIPKTEFNQTNEMTGNVSCSQEDMESLSDVTHINVERGDQLKQPTDVKSVTISDTIEKDIQNKESTCGADIAKIEKSQETTFIKAKVPSIRKNEDDQTGMFKCIECGAHFKRKWCLKRHSQIHLGKRSYMYSSKGSNQTDKFECIECGAHFAQQGILNRHSLIHSSDRPYKCNSCNQSFVRRYNLKNHMIRHSNEKPHTCHACGFRFWYKSTLKRHVCTKQQNQKKAEIKINVKQRERDRPHIQNSIRKNGDDRTDKFECIECGAHFTQKGSLKRHSLIHSREWPYKCNLCDRSFTQKATLSCHMLQHSGKKPYICETCGLPFRLQKSLDRHIFMKHDGQNVIINQL